MFRFTIRELVLLTVIVAMGAAWWVERRQLTRLVREQERWLFDAVIRLDQHGEELRQDADGNWHVHRRAGGGENYWEQVPTLASGPLGP